MPTLEITTVIGCKVNCKYCPQKRLASSYFDLSDQRIMSFEVFKKCLDKVPKEVRIDFSGFAESWLNKECTKMLLYAHENGYKVAVYTTCSGMKINDIEEIMNINFEQFVVHLPDSDGCSNIDVSDQYLEVLKETKKIKGVTYMTMGRLDKRAEQALGMFVPASFFHSRAGNLAGGHVRQIDKLSGEINCQGRNRLDHNVLLPSGDVVLCCMDYGLEGKLGNLLSVSYKDLFLSEKYQEIIASNSSNNGESLCRYCIIARKKQKGFFEYYRLIRQYNFGFKVKAKIYGFFKNLKYL